MLIPSTTTTTHPTVDLLILGAGWTSTFLIPLLKSNSITYAATTTTGRDNTIKFKFDPSTTDPTADYSVLPPARTILITFPLRGASQITTLLDFYSRTHPGIQKPQYILLGSTGIYQIPTQSTWVTRSSPYNTADLRAQAEDHLLQHYGGCVLNLSGLWGGTRQPRNWIERVAKTKEQLAEKTSLHMIHGQDVARGIMALLGEGGFTKGERWMLTDMFVYDWWALALGWGNGGGGGGGGATSGVPGGVSDGVAGGSGSEIRSGDADTQGPHAVWVRELMVERGVRALPRDADTLGRCYDSREFWERFGIAPVRARI